MADSDPTNDTAMVDLDVSRRDRKFLQELLTMARDGVREELSECGGRPRGSQLRREQSAYEQLLVGLERQRVEPDPEVIAVLRELAAVVDAGNEYRRVIAEHDALHDLIGSLERPRHCGSRRGGARAAIRCRGDSPTSRR